METGNEQIRISVRQLVEFILRSGDIDNRHHTSPESAMQELAENIDYARLAAIE